MLINGGRILPGETRNRANLRIERCGGSKARRSARTGALGVSATRSGEPEACNPRNHGGDDQHCQRIRLMLMCVSFEGPTMNRGSHPRKATLDRGVYGTYLSRGATCQQTSLQFQVVVSRQLRMVAMASFLLQIKAVTMLSFSFSGREKR